MKVALARRLVGVLLLSALVATGCSSNASSSSSSRLTLYTCATDKIEQAAISAFSKANPGAKVDVYRAATGQLNSRVAADVRGGGIKADVIWACDPLTMHNYDAQGLLTNWAPPSTSTIDTAYRTPHFTGVDLLYLVAVTHQGVPAPQSWNDLTGPTYHGGVALPSPTFAASALGMLGYFATATDYGLNYFTRLKANGAKRLNSPDDTLAGVAQGTYKAGFALANAAYAAIHKGSPVTVTWPKPGAIAIYAPIGVTAKKSLSPIAREFADFIASPAGQAVIAKNGAYAAMSGVAGPPKPAGSPVASPDWSTLFGQSKTLLAHFGSIFPS
ncbi:MAG TPA: extracellular solute-binding protein [Jatrophihabitans sp.]|jgi:iron(III) transport system substrate-binding protein